MYPFPFFFDPTMIIILPGIVLAMIAQAKVQNTFNKWSQIPTGLSAKDVAETILQENGVHDVRVEFTPGQLSDHYDPRFRTLRLSESTFHANSVAAIAVAAHEAGHAIQHHRHYFPLMLRNAIFPIVSIASNSWIFIVIAGIFLRMPELLKIGVYTFGATFAFSVVTLPVEFDASSRAIQILNQGFLDKQELSGAKKVLNAAALTYVAGAVISLLQLLRIIMLTGGMRRDD